MWIDIYDYRSKPSLIEWNDIEFGDVYTFEDFVSMCLSGFLTDYDGIGYYSDGEKETNIMVIPSDVVDEVTKEFSHVVWYNK